ncbi:MAG: hypothetical protein Q8S73_32320 [Deltaproteobacteria bacterium]|nr:hypothetical protein [Myxococcales bacterium]MDP3218831.1 hypothetical protein [Deltaproteobacteria bacterium]
MRFIALLALALAACSSDPAPQDAAVDSVVVDTGPVDAGPDVLDAPVADTPTADRGVLDTGAVDVGNDIHATDQPTPDTGIDANNLDASDGARDVAVDRGSDVVTDVRLDTGTPDVGSDTGPVDTGSDVPADVRVFCGGALPDPPCRTHADCAICIPGINGPWCCARSGFCALSTNPSCE